MSSKHTISQIQVSKVAYIDLVLVVAHFKILVNAILINLTDNGHVRDAIRRLGTYTKHNIQHYPSVHYITYL